MKSKYFSLLLMMIFFVTYSQTKSKVFNFRESIPLKLSNVIKTDTIKFYSIQTLAKRALDTGFSKELNNQLPINYNWYLDAQRLKDFKNMALNIRTQDFCGRDLLIDIHTDVIQNLYLRGRYER